MDSWFDAFFVLLVGTTALLALLGACLLVGRRLRRSRQASLERETLLIVGTAVADAEARGHRVLTVIHFSRALLSDPVVAARLAERGARVDDLYECLGGLLPPAGDAPVKLKPGDAEPAVGVLLSAGTPEVLVGKLLDSTHQEVREAFAKHGVTAARWRSAPARITGSSSATSSRAQTAPYRALPDANPTTDVLFWDDDKTSMPFVVEVLRGTFGIVEPHASRLMLATHRDGFAVVGTYEHAEAEHLSKAACTLAKERGFPLRVTVAAAGLTKPPSRFGRWLRQRGVRGLRRTSSGTTTA